MATLAEVMMKQPHKIINIGESGSGKTGALASLVKAGYNIHIADFDSGTNILASYLTKEEAGKVEVETFIDKLKTTPLGVVCDGVPTAYPRFLAKLTEWCNKFTLEGKDVVVIDSFSFLGDAVYRWYLQKVGRHNKPELQDWGMMQGMLKDVLTILFSTDVKCHIIINAHIKYIEGENGGIAQGLVNTLGRGLPPQVGRYFNNIIWTGVKAGNRIISTKSTPTMVLKTSAPNFVKDSYGLTTGMADLFSDLDKGIGKE